MDKNRLKNIEIIKEKLNLLQEISSDDAYNKFYKNLFNSNPNLDREMYNKIIQLDPTFKKEQDKIGEYTKWLFRKDNIETLKKTKDEDLYKIKDDLDFFNKAKIKNILPADKKDINKFNLNTLLDFVFSFNKDSEELMSKGEKEREIKKGIKKYDLPNWTVIIPETEEAACYYGKGTKWCTAADYNNQFNNYKSRGDLYILINKGNPSEKYQFHFEDYQFMDVKDRPIRLGDFMNENDDVYNFFSEIKGEDLDFEIAKSCLNVSDTECFENFYTKNFSDDQKEELLRAAFEADENSDSFYAVSSALGYIDYPEMKNDFRRDFLWGLESSLGNRYDDENYDAMMFIDNLGGFTDENIDDIIKAVDFKDVDEINKIFELADKFDGTKILLNAIEDNNININFDLIKTIDDLKSKFNYDEYRKTLESKLVKVKINNYDLEKGTINITITPKDENGDLIDNKKETGNINYKNLVTYLTQPQLFNESIKNFIIKTNKKDLSKKLFENDIKNNKISFEHEHLDHYDGQDNYELGIYEDGEVMGYVDYTIYNNEITVSDILVRPNRRREGFGSMLIKKMKELHPDAKYKPSMKTDLGSKFIHKDIKIDENEKIDREKLSREMIKKAHDAITRKKGKEYAPDVHELQAWIDDYIKKHNIELDEAKKTDYSKEKSQGLHGWFARRGGKGKSKGWVDCNTCRKDPETGRKKCKSCGRKDGEKRKYPACRPTPASCGTRGKGKKWGKKSNNESENKNTMKSLIKQKLHEMVEENHNEYQNYMFFNNLKTIHQAISEILEMDPQAVDQLLSDGHNWATDHMATSADDIEEVYHFLSATLDEHDHDSYDGNTEAGYEDEYGSVEDAMQMMNEAKYKGKTVKLGKPTKGDVKKFKVFVKNKKGKVVKVNFGDPNMEIKRDNPKRRKSFRARHKCSQAKDRTTPKYWSCRMWSKKPVSKIVGENFGFDENTRIFTENNNMTQPITKPKTKPQTKPEPSKKDKPFLPEVAPGTRTQPKAMNEGVWKHIMKGVRGGETPFSIVVLEPTWDDSGKKYKVIDQDINIKNPDLIPAAYEVMKKKHPNAIISIEDGGGQMVWNSKH